MFGTLKLLFLVLLFNLTAGVHAQQSANVELSENQKIDYLIDKIEHLKDAEFIRNGTSHTAKEAASHLRMKRTKAGSRIKSVEQFINKIASESSITGKPYQIKFANGKIVMAKDYYYECLKNIEP